MRWTIRVVLSLVLVAAFAGISRSAVAGVTYGLVIGIDNYTGLAPKLEGAVNDARDVADALTKSGAREVKLLLDADANRDAIMAAWDELLGRARKGDILVFHYAGHGGQEPEHVKGSEATGYDSTLLLAAFDIEGEGTRQRIIDDELGWMFKRASDAGIDVLVAIDACHSGSMTRAFDTASGIKPRVRAATYPPILITDDHLPPFPTVWAQIPDDLPNVIYFGAVQDDEESPEVTINGQARGALSWALAEGLRGAADANHDGIVTKEELQAFITENIRMQLEGRQHPSVIPSGFRSLAFPVKAAVNTPRVQPQPAQLQLSAATPLTLAVLNTSAVSAEELVGGLKAVKLVALDANPAPMLTWDVARGEVFTDLGDLIYQFGERKADDPTRAFKRAVGAGDSRPSNDGRNDLPKLQDVVDNWHTVERIKQLAESRSLEMALKPDDKLHTEGAKLTFEISGHNQTYFTLFNLGADGTVNFLYPLDTTEVKDPLQIPLGRPYTVPLVVEAPYGADHLVAIASAQPLTALHKTLREFDGKPMASALETELVKQLDGQTYQIGIHGSYTAATKP